MLLDRKSEDVSAKIGDAILAVAAGRGTDKTACPSEIARMLFPKDWRKHMKTVVRVAVNLQACGKVVITQKGLPIDVGQIRGPIRIKIV